MENKEREAMRRFLNAPATEKTAAIIKEIHDIDLPEGATNMDALDAVMKKCHGTSGKPEHEKSAFDALEVDQYNEKNIKRCRAFVDNFSRDLDESDSLLLWGNIGTGKTVTAAAIASDLLGKGFSVKMVSLSEIIKDIESGGVSAYAFLDKISCADLTIFEDFEAEPDSDLARKMIFDAIEDRFIGHRPMIIVTRMAPADMCRKKDGVYSHVYVRILNSCELLQFTGSNRHER